MPMPTITNSNTVLHLGKQPSPHSTFTSFKRWVKESILRNSVIKKEKQDRQVRPQIAPPSTPNSKVKSHKNTSKNATVRRSVSGRRRRSRKQPRPRSKILNLNINDHDKYESWILIDDNNNRVDNKENDDNNKKDMITRPDEDDNGWDDEETLNKDELIIPKINSALLIGIDTADMYDISAVISKSLPDKDYQRSEPFGGAYSKDDFLENTHIIKGSVEHFAYVRTLRKLRGKDKQYSIQQVLLLNNILEKLSFSQLSDEMIDSLNHYKRRVYELNRIKRKSAGSYKDISPYSSLNESTLSLCPSSSANRKLSAILGSVHPTSPITMKYRPSYASSKVVTVFDEETDQLIVKDLPLARRKRRLSDLSNVLNRSATSTSTSTNSSQSSLVTLTDETEQNKYPSVTTKEPDTFLSNLVIRNDDNDGDEDDVPLFVLKEQFRYSGRGYAPLTVPSIGVNCPARVSNGCI